MEIYNATGTENRILDRVDVKNIMRYKGSNTANAIRAIAAFVSLR